MVFSSSAPLSVVVTADAPRSEGSSSLPDDRVITIPCSVPSPSPSADQPITWLELLGQR